MKRDTIADCLFEEFCEARSRVFDNAPDIEPSEVQSELIRGIVSTAAERIADIVKGLAVGDRVYWSDPDDGKGSGIYKLVLINGDVYSLVSDDGSEVGAFVDELTLC